MLKQLSSDEIKVLYESLKYIIRVLRNYCQESPKTIANFWVSGTEVGLRSNHVELIWNQDDNSMDYKMPNVSESLKGTYALQLKSAMVKAILMITTQDFGNADHIAFPLTTYFNEAIIKPTSDGKIYIMVT